MSSNKLLKEAITKWLSGVLLVGLSIFLPAGTLRWKAGWLFMVLLFIPMFLAGIVMAGKSPELLKRRLQAKEEQGEQRTVIRLSGLMFLASFITAGLNYRFGWTALPRPVTAIACVVFLAAYAIFAEVLWENAYLSRTVEVQKNQALVDTGLYGIVRHPMYAATVFLFLSMPLILGSWPSFLIMLIYLPIIAKRMRHEEQFLEERLTGYAEYKKRVRYMVIPFIW